MTFEELATTPNRQLRQLFAVGRPPGLDSLDGWEWRGYNRPATTSLLGIRKFIKGFLSTEWGLEGYNLRVEQNGLAGTWTPAAGSRPYAFYVVTERGGALVIDYAGSHRNPRFGVERFIVDHLVQPDAAAANLLLGRAKLGLLPHSYFVLERMEATAASRWGGA
jgi:hypothetical protein